MWSRPVPPAQLRRSCCESCQHRRARCCSTLPSVWLEPSIRRPLSPPSVVITHNEWFIYTVNIKSTPPWLLLTLLYEILLLNNKMYCITKFCWNISENDKIMIFQPRQPPSPLISQHSRAMSSLSSLVVCWWLWKEPACWRWDEYADLEMDRVTADAQSEDHWQPQPCT